MARIFISLLSSAFVFLVFASAVGNGQILDRPYAVVADEGSSSSATEASLPNEPSGGSDRRPDIYGNTVHAPFSTVGVAVTTGTLGIGVQLATPVTMRLNLRVGGSLFRYNSPLSFESGVSYNGTLRLGSAQAMVDWFPFGGRFHISPGVQVYNGFGGSANLFVPSGQGVTLNHTDYLSDPTTPLTGSGTLRANRVAPMLLVGFGNLVPRSGRHFSFPFEAGIAYQGAPKIKFNLTGNACDTDGENCQPVSSYTELQRNLVIQQGTINNDANPYKFYPIVSFGVGYKF